MDSSIVDTLSVIDDPHLVVSILMWIGELSKEIIPIFAAAFLGFYLANRTNIKAELRLRKRDLDQFKSLLVVEIGSLRDRLIFSSYKLISRYGDLNKNLVTWFVEQQRSMVEPTDVVKGTANSLERAVEDNRIDELSMISRPPDGVSVAIPAVSLPFLDSTMDSIKLLDEIDARHLLEIHTQIGFLNDAARDCKAWHERTFEEVTEVNRSINENNQKRRYLDYGERSKRICDMIDKLRKSLKT